MIVTITNTVVMRHHKLFLVLVTKAMGVSILTDSCFDKAYCNHDAYYYNESPFLQGDYSLQEHVSIQIQIEDPVTSFKFQKRRFYFLLSDCTTSLKNPKSSFFSIDQFRSSIAQADMISTVDGDSSIHRLKIQYNKMWFNHDVNQYLKGLQMVVWCMNDSVLHHFLTTYYFNSDEMFINRMFFYCL